jgi:hypothetical protein
LAPSVGRLLLQPIPLFRRLPNNPGVCRQRCLRGPGPVYRLFIYRLHIDNLDNGSEHPGSCCRRALCVCMRIVSVGEHAPAARPAAQVIRVSGYIADEKTAIARRYLEPQAQKDSGVPEGAAKVTDEAMKELIHEYARCGGPEGTGKQEKRKGGQRAESHREEQGSNASGALGLTKRRQQSKPRRNPDGPGACHVGSMHAKLRNAVHVSTQDVSPAALSTHAAWRGLFRAAPPEGEVARVRVFQDRQTDSQRCV